MHLQWSSCVSFNQLSVHMLLLLLFISIMVAHRDYQQEQDQSVFGLGCILKWPLCAYRRNDAGDPQVQQLPQLQGCFALYLRNWNLSHTPAEICHTDVYRKNTSWLLKSFISAGF